MELVLIPPGKFQEGTTEADIEFAILLDPTIYHKPLDAEKPQAAATIATVLSWEASVTNEQFKTFVA